MIYKSLSWVEKIVWILLFVIVIIIYTHSCYGIFPHMGSILYLAFVWGCVFFLISVCFIRMVFALVKGKKRRGWYFAIQFSIILTASISIPKMVHRYKIYQNSDFIEWALSSLPENYVIYITNGDNGFKNPYRADRGIFYDGGIFAVKWQNSIIIGQPISDGTFMLPLNKEKNTHGYQDWDRDALSRAYYLRHFAHRYNAEALEIVNKGQGMESTFLPWTPKSFYMDLAGLRGCIAVNRNNEAYFINRLKHGKVMAAIYSPSNPPNLKKRLTSYAGHIVLVSIQTIGL